MMHRQNNGRYFIFEICVLVVILSNFSAVESTPWLVHTNLDTIQRLEMETWTESTVANETIGAVAVDYHYKHGYLYWTDQLEDRMTRANLSNPASKEDIVIYTLNRADGIAVDWIHNHVYWIDAMHKHLRVSELDGTLRKTLIDGSLGYPRAIAVYPSRGWLFFTDIDNHVIERLGLDGSSRQVIVSTTTTSISQPNGLSIDFSSDRLYWIDNIYKHIKSSTLDGSDIRILTTSAEFMPFTWGLIVFQDWIYWTSFTNNTIYRVDKTTGTNFQVVKTGLRTPVGIKIYSQENQPTGVNLCASNNGDCEQLCLPTPQSTKRCVCADGFQLNSDGKTCNNTGSGNWLTFANLKNIERIDVDTSVTEVIASGLTNAVDLDIHYKLGLVFWTDIKEKRIMRSSVSKTSVSGNSEVVLTDIVDVPDGIAVDWIYNKIFWTDTGHDHIQLANLDGSHRRTILKGGSLHEPRAIVVDPTTGWLFFSDWGNTPRIERCQMDGGDRRVIIDNDIVWPNGMSIDHIGRRLYWIDGKLNQIKSTKFDGTDTHLVLKDPENLPKPFDLVVFNSYIYWSNWQYRSICRVNKYTGGDFLKIANNVLSPMGIQMFGPGVQIDGINVCGDNNGECSHICYPLPPVSTSRSTMFQCMCPDNFIMEADNKTCTAIEPPTNLKLAVSGNSISVSWTLPVTSDVIQETEIELHDNGVLFYTTAVYFTDSSKTITNSQLMRCHMYTIKLRIRYTMKGWSSYIKEKFWITDNLVFTEKFQTATVAWTTIADRQTFDVLFNTQFGQNIVIFSGGVATNGTTKYSSLVKTGLQIQFTLASASQTDVGLYKSMASSTATSIDGCALLVMTDKPTKPNITSSGNHPFVGSKATFKCSSQAQRWPSYISASLQYNWSVDSTLKTDVLNINPVEKSDKGKMVSCTATDDRGKNSESSDSIILDPYYGPENMLLSISDGSVNIAKGNRFGPITCSASCYPKCIYIWQRLVNGVYTNFTSGQNIEIGSVGLEDAGVYRCVALHQNDSSRKTTVNIQLQVHEPQTTTTAKASTTSTSTATTTTSRTPTRQTTTVFTTATSSSTSSTTMSASGPSAKSSANTTTYALAGVAGLLLIVMVSGLIIFCLKRRKVHGHKPFDDDKVRMSDVYQTIDENGSDFDKSMDNPYETLGTSATENIYCSVASRTNVMPGITQGFNEEPPYASSGQNGNGNERFHSRNPANNMLGVVQPGDTYLTPMDITNA